MQIRTGHRFRRAVIGYRRRDVDDALSSMSEQLEQAEQSPDLGTFVGRHLGGLLARFADVVDEGEREAADTAARTIADAERRAAELVEQAQQLAASRFADAAREYEAHIAARDHALAIIGDAMEQLGQALAALQNVPAFPPLTVLELTEPVEAPASPLVA